MIAAVLIISMIYMNNAVQKSKVIQEYQKQLPSNLQNLYEKITKERLHIYYFGYVLGFILSFIIIISNYNILHNKTNNKNHSISNMSIICLVIIISFLTNYFYYILSPKTTYMLEHINNPEQTKAWLIMYRHMQVYFHLGFVIGIIAIAVAAFAFRC